MRPDLCADSRSAALPSGAPPRAAPLDAAPLEAAPLEAAPPNAARPARARRPRPARTPTPPPRRRPRCRGGGSTRACSWCTRSPGSSGCCPRSRWCCSPAARATSPTSSISLGAAALIVVFGVLRWRFTQYRITPDRVELHSGWLRRQRRSVPRDRIRTVDLTARLEHRIFGLSVVKIGSATGGTGEHAGLALDAVSKAEADRLRRELLDRSPAAGSATPAAAPPSDRAGPPRLGVAALRPALVLLAGRDRHRGGRAVQPPQRGRAPTPAGSRATPSNAWPERVSPPPSG